MSAERASPASPLDRGGINGGLIACAVACGAAMLYVALVVLPQFLGLLYVNHFAR